MKLNWTKGMSPEDKDSFLSLLKNNTIVLNRLGAIIEDFNYETSTKVEDFDNPNWAYKRAFKDGQRSAYNKILDLLQEK